MKKCLVLGAGGFIGRNLCAQLLKEGWYVRAFEKFNCEQLRELKVHDIVETDYLATEDFRDVLDGIDVVYHLISTTLPKAGSDHIISEEIEKNLIPTIRLLESMKKVGTKKIVFASSGGSIYGDYSGKPNMVGNPLRPKCTYALQKQWIEDSLQFYKTIYGINICIARISNPYGVGQSVNRVQGVIPIFIDRLLKNMPIVLLGADSRRDYIYMDDVTDALVRLGEYEGAETVFNIASGESYSLSEIVSKIEIIADRNFESVSKQEQRDFDVDHSIIDVSVTQKELGWKAKISLEHGIEKLYHRLTNTITKSE